jgi:ubiquinone/menaquinone biosynthesis C-methylase UbiE
MNYLEIFYPESKFGNFSDIDGTITFYLRVNALLERSNVVLDVGCGQGSFMEDQVTIRKNLRNLKGKASLVIGIDTDKKAQNNPSLDQFFQISNNKWPIPNDSVDVILCDYVLEHIADPDLFFSEVHRVLKNKGFLCLRTSNRWNYFAVFASLIPNKFHAKITSFVQQNRKESTVFPTYYRCNSIKKINKMMKKNGFNCVVYGYEAEPSYLSFSPIAYFLGVLHQKFAFGMIKPAIFGFGKIYKDKDQ